jgi:hypothetical protein
VEVNKELGAASPPSECPHFSPERPAAKADSNGTNGDNGTAEGSTPSETEITVIVLSIIILICCCIVVGVPLSLGWHKQAADSASTEKGEIVYIDTVELEVLTQSGDGEGHLCSNPVATGKRAEMERLLTQSRSDNERIQQLQMELMLQDNRERS